jgi:hypothetical protein
MISCNQCGTAISSIARFCNNCGAAISNSGQLNTTLFSLDPKSISANKIKSTKNLESISQAIFVAPAHFLNKLSEIFSTAGVKPYSILSGEDEKDIKNKIETQFKKRIDAIKKFTSETEMQTELLKLGSELASIEELDIPKEEMQSAKAPRSGCKRSDRLRHHQQQNLIPVRPAFFLSRTRS